jgi:hypothetical protein
MSFVVDTTSSGKASTPAPEGAHLSRLISIIDLGLQEDSWQGQVNVRRKVRLTFELVNEPMEDGRPFVVSKEFTLNFGDKSKLKPVLEAVNGSKLGKNFDLGSLLGSPCLVQVQQDTSTTSGNKYAKLVNVSGAPKGMPVAPCQNPTVLFNTDAWDQAIYDTLPKFVQEKIQARKPKPDSSIPF